MPSRRLPPLHAIRAFEAAARHLSMSHAARELNVTPGAVSRHVRALEENLGNALFVRRATGLELTSVGRALAEGTREALDRLEEATTGVRLRQHRRLSLGVYGIPVARPVADPAPTAPRAPGSGRHAPAPIPRHAAVAVRRRDRRVGCRTAIRSGRTALDADPTVAVAAPRRPKRGPIDFARVPLLHVRPRSEDRRRWLVMRVCGRAARRRHVESATRPWKPFRGPRPWHRDRGTARARSCRWPRGARPSRAAADAALFHAPV